MNTLSLETLHFLLSPEGDALMSEAGVLEGDFLTRLTRLRKTYPADQCSAALELLDLRKRAERKFSLAARMFFTREALEQASGEVVARYRAKKFKEGSAVLDLACGIGGDTIGLASRCRVTAVDSDPVRLAMAERNLQVYGLSDRVKFICEDVTQVPLQADAAFLDPSRRDRGRRVISLSDISPSVGFIQHMIQSVPNCAIKLSPGTDYDELESLGGEIEFISNEGECKEALVWCGDFKTAARRATILPGEYSIVHEQVEPVRSGLPLAFLYEPDPAVIRAHLVEQLAHRMGARKIDDRIAYLTSADRVETPFASVYRVIHHMPFALKPIVAKLRQLNAGRVIVKKRGVPFDPLDIQKKIKTDGSEELVLILTRLADQPHAIICGPMLQSR